MIIMVTQEGVDKYLDRAKRKIIKKGIAVPATDICEDTSIIAETGNYMEKWCNKHPNYNIIVRYDNQGVPHCISDPKIAAERVRNNVFGAVAVHSLVKVYDWE